MRPLAMENASMNPYEKQLYTVFKTFDVDNEEALDKSAVLDLCDALQLEDRGAALVDTLFERSAERITFTQFRNGLLSVLSGDSVPVEPATAVTTPCAPPTHSDEDSSGREIAPKFIFGSKKYGRRSRPQRSSNDASAPRAASVSRLDVDDGRARSSQRMRCRRSASAMETRDLNSTTDDDDAPPEAFDHDRRIDRDQALALCRDLRMEGIDRRFVDRIFEDSRATDTTVGEFFDRLNVSLTSSIEGARESVADVDADDAEDDDAGVASELVVDAWERAGVPRPRRLLLELGFGAATVRPPDLDRALDDELTALAEPMDERRDARALLLAATLALARLRLRRARRRADLASAERDKLRADVTEANRRARLLAQDVDETHARMEAELATNLRRAEARHADAARQAAAEAGAERERVAGLRARLEAETARHAEAEARLRAEAEAERARAEALATRATAAEARAAAADREATRLADEARVATGARGAGEAGAADQAALRALEARLDEARREAQGLRDRNDELCGALEARALEMSTSHGGAAACGDLSEELRSLLSPEAIEDCDSSPISIEQKVMEYREAAQRLWAIFEDVGASAGASAGACGACGACRTLAELRARARDVSDALLLVGPAPATRDAVAQTPDALQSHDAAAQVAATSCDSSMQTEVELDEACLNKLQLRTLVDELKSELADAEQKHEEERQKLQELISSLEANLEALSEEYERCEEYWSRKLDSERAAHDAEAELLARQAPPRRPAPAASAAPALPPLHEQAQLEAQVADLEKEFAAHRAAAAAELEARDAELRRLRARTCPPAPAPAPAPAPPPPPGPGEAAALRARAARAEAAVRRLHARLHAADLLVKDLYVENCHLAHSNARARAP